MATSTLLIVVLVVLLIGAAPAWPHSRSWGYYPSGLLGLIVLIVIIASSHRSSLVRHRQVVNERLCVGRAKSRTTELRGQEPWQRRRRHGSK